MNMMKFLSGEASKKRRAELDGARGVMWIPTIVEELETFEIEGYTLCLIQHAKDKTYQLLEYTTAMMIGLSHRTRDGCVNHESHWVKTKIEQHDLESAIRYRIKERGFLNGSEANLPFKLEDEKKQKDTDELFIINKEAPPKLTTGTKVKKEPPKVEKKSFVSGGLF